MDMTALGAPASPTTLVLICAIVVFAAIIQAGIGMGFGLTAAPLLALIDPVLVPVPALFLTLLTASLGAWSERDAIRWNEVGTGMIGRLVGLAIALAILERLTDERGFLLFFGILVSLAVLLSISGLRIAFTRANLIGLSTISGIMGALTSVGGPPMALIYQSRPAAKARPTLAAFFATGCVVSIAGLWTFGHAGPRDALIAGLLLPPMLLGTAIGRRFRGRFDRRFRLALLAVSGVAGVLLIQRGLG